jgi:DNA-binding PucR family transcriptional regulator
LGEVMSDEEAAYWANRADKVIGVSTWTSAARDLAHALVEARARLAAAERVVEAARSAERLYHVPNAGKQFRLHLDAMFDALDAVGEKPE